jgi:hypothetical protein
MPKDGLVKSKVKVEDKRDYNPDIDTVRKNTRHTKVAPEHIKSD